MRERARLFRVGEDQRRVVAVDEEFYDPVVGEGDDRA